MSTGFWLLAALSLIALLAPFWDDLRLEVAGVSR